MKIWLNGCFDILHHGHFKLLQHASSFGGQVIIGIDSDERVKQMKGEGRPFHSENERAFNLKQIKGVDAVVIFNSDEMLRELLERYKPDKFIDNQNTQFFQNRMYLLETNIEKHINRIGNGLNIDLIEIHHLFYSEKLYKHDF